MTVSSVLSSTDHSNRQAGISEKRSIPVCRRLPKASIYSLHEQWHVLVQDFCKCTVRSSQQVNVSNVLFILHDTLEFVLQWIHSISSPASQTSSTFIRVTYVLESVLQFWLCSKQLLDLLCGFLRRSLVTVLQLNHSKATHQRTPLKHSTGKFIYILTTKMNVSTTTTTTTTTTTSSFCLTGPVQSYFSPMTHWTLSFLD